jgi:hypothetical protein
MFMRCGGTKYSALEEIALVAFALTSEAMLGQAGPARKGAINEESARDHYQLSRPRSIATNGSGVAFPSSGP